MGWVYFSLPFEYADFSVCGSHAFDCMDVISCFYGVCWYTRAACCWHASRVWLGLMLEVFLVGSWVFLLSEWLMLTLIMVFHSWATFALLSTVFFLSWHGEECLLFSFRFWVHVLYFFCWCEVMIRCSFSMAIWWNIIATNTITVGGCKHILTCRWCSCE